MFIFKTKRKLIHELIEKAERLGLPIADIDVAKVFLNANEFGLSFDQIITQLDECGIGVDNDFYSLTQKIGKKLKLPESDYDFIFSLIKRHI